MRREMKHAAQDKIVAAICNAAFMAEDDGNADLAEAIRKEGCLIAKRWNITNVHGLPETWPARSDANYPPL